LSGVAAACLYGCVIILSAAAGALGPLTVLLLL
jgi:hypothetical protein